MKKSLKNKKGRVVATAATAVALAAAAGFVLWETIGDKRRAKAKAWMAKARREILRDFMRAKRLSEGEYKRIVDRVAKRYANLDGASKPEFQKIVKDLKSGWGRVQSQAKVIAKQIQRKERRFQRNNKTKR